MLGRRRLSADNGGTVSAAQIAPPALPGELSLSDNPANQETQTTQAHQDDHQHAGSCPDVHLGLVPLVDGTHRGVVGVEEDGTVCSEEGLELDIGTRGTPLDIAQVLPIPRATEGRRLTWIRRRHMLSGEPTGSSPTQRAGRGSFPTSTFATGSTHRDIARPRPVTRFPRFSYSGAASPSATALKTPRPTLRGSKRPSLDTRSSTEP